MTTFSTIMPDSARPLVSIDDVARFLPDVPVRTTRGRGWPGVTLDLHAANPEYAVKAFARDHHLICMAREGSGRLIQRRAGQVHDSLLSAGMSLMTPAGQDATFEGHAPLSARLRISSALVAQAAAEIEGRSAIPFEIINVFRTADPVIEGLVTLILAEIDLQPHPTQDLVMDALSCALTAHLLRRYNAFDPPPSARDQGLGSQVVARIVDYIHDNMDRSISLTELSEISQISRFNFARQFRRATGFSPIAYVERTRLVRAQELLVRGEMPIVEIALAVGFSDQSEFTRRFHRSFGITPAAFARERGVSKTPRRPR